MFDFIKDIISSFRQSSLERIKSPFLGAFVFSWLSFNWQLIAVLFSEKIDIFIKLNYINEKFGIESLLIGPIFTTSLICIILPTANKLVTSFQKNTNHDTNGLILDSKIAIADKQLQLADFEAKKKLSEEREKKNIEADIETIKNKSKLLKEQVDELKYDTRILQEKNEVSQQNESLLKAKVGSLDTALNTAEKENEKLKNDYANFKSINERQIVELDRTRADLSRITEEALKNSVLLQEITDEKFKLEGQVKLLKDQLQEATNSTRTYKTNSIKSNINNQELTLEPIKEKDSEYSLDSLLAYRRAMKSLKNEHPEAYKYLKSIDDSAKNMGSDELNK